MLYPGQVLCAMLYTHNVKYVGEGVVHGTPPPTMHPVQVSIGPENVPSNKSLWSPLARHWCLLVRHVVYSCMIPAVRSASDMTGYNTPASSLGRLLDPRVSYSSVHSSTEKNGGQQQCSRREIPTAAESFFKTTSTVVVLLCWSREIAKSVSCV